jgi:hypothetical protein
MFMTSLEELELLASAVSSASEYPTETAADIPMKPPPLNREPISKVKCGHKQFPVTTHAEASTTVSENELFASAEASAVLVS